MESIKDKLLNQNYDPRNTVIVEKFESLNTLSMGNVISSDFDNNDEVILNVKTDGMAFLVLADTFYPGWKAYIDGVETEIFRVNGVIRGILIPEKGQFKINFIFKPLSFYIGASLSIFTFLFLLFYAVYFLFKKSRYSNNGLE
jgi:uncharacterized membrane protein YfhO